MWRANSKARGCTWRNGQGSWPKKANVPVDLSLPPKPVSADRAPDPPLFQGTTTTWKTSAHRSASSPSSLPKHTPNGPFPRLHEPHKTPLHSPNGKNGQKTAKTSCLCDNRYLGGGSPIWRVISWRGGRGGRFCWALCPGRSVGLDKVNKLWRREKGRGRK